MYLEVVNVVMLKKQVGPELERVFLISNLIEIRREGPKIVFVTINGHETDIHMHDEHTSEVAFNFLLRRLQEGGGSARIIDLDTLTTGLP